ncbi:MAG: glycosyltransferase family 39 protein [Acidimicrobiia bacterium]|nr:glycosyltransferase family 39 protein [Acidimicrobiia bacterium]
MNDLDSALAGAQPSNPPSAEAPRSLRLVFGVVVVVGLAAAAGLRFVAQPDLWLDEALTVNIAQLPLDQLRGALLRDGAPPLYYVLLHGWIGVFGTSSFAVRSLSGAFGVIAVGLAFIAGTRLGRDRTEQRWMGFTAMIVVAVSPYAIHYSTEARMYSLTMVLVLLGVILGIDAWRRPTPVRLAGIALVTGALLLTQYWSFFMVGVVLVGLALGTWRHLRPARRLLVAVLVGCAIFLPWLPTFRRQLAHTGTPWDTATSPVAGAVKAMVAFGGGRNPEGWPQIAALSALLVLVIAMVVVGAKRSESPTSGAALTVIVVGLGTFAVGIVGSWLAGVGFQDRYAAVVFPCIALAVAVGVATIGDLRLRVAILIALAGLGLLGGIRAARHVRTPSGAVASMLRADLQPTDVIAYCPDQLGPSTARLLPDTTRQFTFPDLASPRFVDWTDYAERNDAAVPGRFARQVGDRAGTGRVWLVWSPGYRTFGTKCEAVVNALGRTRTPFDVVRSFDGPDGDTVEVRRFDP